MLLIKDKLISLDIIEEQFVCDLHACKGACCVEGDMGAPLEDDEALFIASFLDNIKPYLTPEGRSTLEEVGAFLNDHNSLSTTLIGDHGPCAYVHKDADGMVKCGIEMAYRNGSIPFNKPISCHLYPIRIVKNEATEFEALNYHRWHICQDACSLGCKLKIPVYQFLKEPLIRKYGQAFYNELDEIAQDWLKKSKGQ